MQKESRQIKTHPQLLLDVITRQAGTISKAMLEGVMNSVDAKATRCDITLTNTSLVIDDDGNGFRSRDEIVQFFETFGTPHTEAEGKVYGTFRMGRGQIFAFGSNVWRTGDFRMAVDIKRRGFDYDLETLPESHKGCRIEVSLYKPLLPSDLHSTLREVEKMAKYVPIVLTVNGKVVSVDPASEKWDHITDEAYIKIREGSTLAVYNLGVWVKDFGNWQLGCGGTVVSRKQLALNFARNDIMVNECAVWRKVKKLVDQRATEKNKRKPTLDDGERQRLAEQVATGEIAPDEAAELKLFTDVSGRHLSAYQLARNKAADRVTSAPKGDRLGDKILQSGAIFVIAEETIERFGCDDLKGLVKIVQVNCGVRYWKPEVIAFKDATKGMNSTHVILDPKQWNPREKAWVALFESQQRDLLFGFVKGEEIDWNGMSKMRRKVLVGESESALAWTDGSSYICFSRNFLRYIQFSMKGAMEFFEVGLHEYCHDDNDAGTHVHSPDFYQRFHDCISGVREASVAAFNELPALLERHGLALNAWILKQKDAEAKLELAKAKHPSLVGNEPKVEPIVIPAPAPAPVPPKVEEPVAAKTVKITAIQSVGGNPYKGATSYGLLYALGSQKEWLRSDLLAAAAEATGKSVKSLAMSLQVLMNQNHKSNGGKSRGIKNGDRIRLVRAELTVAA